MEPWQGSSSHILFRSFGNSIPIWMSHKCWGLQRSYIYIWYGFAANLIWFGFVWYLGLPIPSIGYLSISHKLIVISPFSDTSKYHIVGQKSWNSHEFSFYPILYITHIFPYFSLRKSPPVSCQKPMENSTEFRGRLGERHCLCLRRWSMELHQAWRMSLGESQHDFPNWLDRK